MYHNIVDDIISNTFYAPEMLKMTQKGDLSTMFVDMFDNPQRYDFGAEQTNNQNIGVGFDEREKLKPSEWAMRYRRIKGQQMSFARHRYQVPIIDDMSPKQVIEKAAQLGLSEIALTKIFWWSDYRKGRANIIYTFPTFSDMCTYATARITPIITDAMPIQQNDYGFQAEYLLDDEENRITYIESMINSNSTQIKKIRDTFLFLKGTISDRNAISVDSDWNIHDEVNFSDQSTLNKFRSRIGAETSMGWEYDFSTPTIPGYGVSSIFQKSDQKRWYIKCPHCGKTQHMEFETHVVEKKRKSLKDKQEYFYRCSNPNCHREITHDTIVQGQFIAEYPENKEWSGYHIDKMLVKSATALMESKEGYRRVADFYNFDLGRAYSERTISLTQEIIRECMDKVFRLWSSAKPEDGVVMGCDQGDTLWVIFSRKNPITGKRQIIYMEEIDEKECADHDPFARLDELVQRYNVQCGVIDMNPNKNDARKLCLRYADKIPMFMATYASFRGEIVSYDRDNIQVNIDRTEYFKETFNHIYTHQVEIPDNTSIGEVFVEHLTNIKKESTKNEETSEIKEWFVAIGPDHLGHANLYNEVAYEYYYGILEQESETKPMASLSNPHWNVRDVKNQSSATNTKFGQLKDRKTVPYKKMNKIRPGR